LQKPVIILGIDPGTLLMGYCVIEASKNIFTIKSIDVLKLSSKKDHYQRLQLVHQKITELVDQYAPNEFAIEAPFFGKNVQSMLKLGRAQGVAIAAAMTKNIPVTEYSPRKIKQSITGSGNADKEQVWKMLQRLTALPDKPKYYDATDALAVAICHFYGSNSITGKKATGAKKALGWEKFIQQNPERILKVR
jgi:crossover junction endodeoxyribonuclease RuvC